MEGSYAHHHTTNIYPLAGICLMFSVHYHHDSLLLTLTLPALARSVHRNHTPPAVLHTILFVTKL